MSKSRKRKRRARPGRVPAVAVYVDIVTEHVHKLATAKIPEGDSEGLWAAVHEQVKQEYQTGMLRKRVRRFVQEKVLIVNAHEGKIAKLILQEIAEELVEEVVGRHPIPRGIEDGDMWLATDTLLQRAFQEEHGEDAILVVMAKRDEDGNLGPAFFWTEDEDLIADAQRGNRRYRDLLARQGL